MFKLIFQIFLLVFSSISLFANSLDFTQQELNYIKNNKIKVASLPDFPPFNIYEDGKFSGLSNDILNLISKKYGLKFEFEIDNWPNNLKKFKEKKVDIIDVISFKKRD